MATSELFDILHNSQMSDSDKITHLVTEVIKPLQDGIAVLQEQMTGSVVLLDSLMDAHGNNGNEHHAKTMVLYGRKLTARDSLNGVDNIPRVRTTDDPDDEGSPLYPDHFSGLRDVLAAHAGGDYKVIWDVTDCGMSSAFETLPATTSLVQYHKMGTSIKMPGIVNLNDPSKSPDPDIDPDDPSAGTNTYELKPGYAISGWTINHNHQLDGSDVPYDISDPNHLPQTPVYKYDEIGNDYLYVFEAEPNTDPVVYKKVMVLDTRVFEFDSQVYKLPYRRPDSFTPVINTEIDTEDDNVRRPMIHFKLKTIPIWYNIVFIVQKGTKAENAPSAKALRVRLGVTITLPSTQLITMDSGWKIDTSQSMLGTWSTAATDPDHPDPGPLPQPMELEAGQQIVIGSETGQLPPSVQKFYLKIVQA